MKKEPIPEKPPIKWTKKDTVYAGCLLLVFIPIILLNFTAEFIRNKQKSNYDGNTTGRVLSIKATQTQHQGFDGTTTWTAFYTVSFMYTVNGKVYGNGNRVPNKAKYLIFIRHIRESNYKKEVRVKYKLTNPEESLVLVDDD